MPQKLVINKSNTKDTYQNQCAICLESLSETPKLTLECSHTFHQSCLKELRKLALQQTCPICRANLPPSAKDMCIDAWVIFKPIEKRVKQGGP